MAVAPPIVSLWRQKDKQGFLCSGLLLTGSHILTVGHAFDARTEKDPIYVRLIDGVDGDVEATVLHRHRERDAAILELQTAVGVATSPGLATDGRGYYEGRRVTLRVVDPDNYGRTTFSNYSIGRFDQDTGEYIISPEDARGHSGGIVEVDGMVVGLLSRRKREDPLCRAVAVHLLSGWIQSCIGSPATLTDDRVTAPPAGRASPAYEALVEKVRLRIRDRLTHPGMDSLARSWGTDPLAAFYPGNTAGQLQELLDGLYRATESCRESWRRSGGDLLAAVKDECRALLSELVKLAVNPASGNADLGVVGAAAPENLYLACTYEGTADVIYCALWDLPHPLEPYAQDDGVVSRGAVHLNDLLPSGQGEDLRQEVLKKLWLMVMGGEPPGRIDGRRYEQLVFRIEHQGKRDNKRYFVVAQSVDNPVVRNPYQYLTTGLRLGWALRTEGHCDYLLVDETALIDTAYEYLQLLERI